MAFPPKPPQVGGDAVVGAIHGRGLSFPEETPPRPGRALEVADGVLWLRLPVAGALGHVNAYALDDGDGWTILDAGQDDAATEAAWTSLLAGPLRRKPIARIVLTHHHPDHAGRAAVLAATGAPIWASRGAWLSLRLLAQEDRTSLAAARGALLRRMGLDAAIVDAVIEAARARDTLVAAPPPGYRRLVEGATITMAGRAWRIRLGDGHATEHASFWSEDGSLALVGDQALPAMSANVGTDAEEPEGNPVGAWLDAAERLGRGADDKRLALPGHDRPYRGLGFRLQQIAAKHGAVLDRLRGALAAGPVSAAEVVPLLHGGATEPVDIALAASEAQAHFRYLVGRGEALAATLADGIERFRPVATG